MAQTYLGRTRGIDNGWLLIINPAKKAGCYKRDGSKFMSKKLNIHGERLMFKGEIQSRYS